MVFEGDSLKGYILDFKDDKLVKVELPNVEERKEEKWIPVVNVDNSPFDNIIYKELRSMALRVKHKTCSIDTLIDRLDYLSRDAENGQ